MGGRSSPVVDSVILDTQCPVVLSEVRIVQEKRLRQEAFAAAATVCRALAIID
jgi:hypothetical protein